MNLKRVLVLFYLFLAVTIPETLNVGKPIDFFIRVNEKAIAVACTNDPKLRIYNVYSQKCITSSTEDDHSEPITFIINLNERLIASASKDLSIKIWDISSLECKKTLKGHQGVINNIIRFNDYLIASISDDKTIKIWDTHTKIEKHMANRNKSDDDDCKTLNEHSSRVTNIVKLSDNTIVTTGEDSLIKIWQASTGDCLSTITENKNPVICLARLDDNRFISVDSEKLKVWDSFTKKCLHHFPLNTTITKILVLNNNIIATSGSSLDLYLLSNELHKTLQSQVNITSIEQISDRLLASATHDSTRLWDFNDRKLENEVLNVSKGSNSYVNCIVKIHEMFYAKSEKEGLITFDKI